MALLLVYITLLQFSTSVCAERHGTSHSARHRQRSPRATRPKRANSPIRHKPLRGIQSDSWNLHGVYLGFIIEGYNSSMKAISEALRGMTEINGTHAATYGRYAQVPSETFTGRWQLLNIMDDVKASGAVFQPAIMIKGWGGFKRSDNHQAVAVAKTLNKFTQAGIPVWCRPFHEMNWYIRDGTYEGTKADFKEGWAVLAAAMHAYAPDVLMHWSPNVASMREYAEYEPDDFDSTVDIVGIDYYPKTRQESTTDHFIEVMKGFHDKYAINGRLFALGEAGLHYQAPLEDRVTWLVRLTKAKKVLPNFLSVTWYNCKKEWDYKLVGDGLKTSTLREKLS